MVKVLVFGDSRVSGLSFEESLEYSYTVESYPGFLARGMDELLSISLKENNYGIVVLCCGINDLGHGDLPQTVVDSVLHLEKMVIAAEAQPILVYLHPSHFNYFNELLGEQSTSSVATFFYDLEPDDLQKDQFHLSDNGKEHFSESLQCHVETV